MAQNEYRYNPTTNPDGKMTFAMGSKVEKECLMESKPYANMGLFTAINALMSDCKFDPDGLIAAKELILSTPAAEIQNFIIRYRDPVDENDK